MRNRRASAVSNGELDSRDVPRVSVSDVFPIGSAKEAKEGSRTEAYRRAELRVIEIKRPSARTQRSGLLAWITVELGDLVRIENITVRRTTTGMLTLSFPERIDAHGVRHAIVCPKNREARRRIEKLVFEQLNLAPEAAEDELC